MKSVSEKLRKAMHPRREELGPPNAFWVVYPKGTDINRDTLWPILAEYGIRPISQLATDGVSALRFRPLRDGESPFAPGR